HRQQQQHPYQHPHQPQHQHQHQHQPPRHPDHRLQRTKEYDPFTTTFTGNNHQQSPTTALDALLRDTKVVQELRLIARKLVQKQRNTEDGSPSLFVILPTTLSQGHFGPVFSAGELGQEYQLYFLCDYDDTVDNPLLLHLCEHSGSTHIGDTSLTGTATVTATTSTTTTTTTSPLSNSTSAPKAVPAGYVLSDPEEFLSSFRIPMLSLLCALLDNDQASPLTLGTVASDPTLYQRCQIAIHMLASHSIEDLEDFRDRPLEADTTEYDSFPLLRPSDFFWDSSWSAGVVAEDSDMIVDNDLSASDTSLQSGQHLDHPQQPQQQEGLHQHDQEQRQMIVLGGLHPMSTSSGSILWLCPQHNEIRCKSASAAVLLNFIKLHHGECIAAEKAIEIQMTNRKLAQELYDLIYIYPCVLKLKISLAWPDLNEDDLWRLCEVVHGCKVRDLTVDCGNGEVYPDMAVESKSTIPGESHVEQISQEQWTEKQHRQPYSMDMTGSSSGLSFKPLLAMIFRPGLVSFTVENFMGYIPPLEATLSSPQTLHHGYNNNNNNTGSNNVPFSLAEFRHSTSSSGTTIVSIPPTNGLKKCSFRHWPQKPDLTRISTLVGASPNLTELEMECESIEAAMDELERVTDGFQTMTFLRLSETPRESIEITFGSSDEKEHYEQGGDDYYYNNRHPPLHKPRIKRVQRSTVRMPSNLVQSPCGLDTLIIGRCLELWRHSELMRHIVSNNVRTLCNIELKCRTDHLVDLWRIMAHNPEGRFRIRLNDTVCSLMSWDRHQPKYTTLVAHSYYPDEMGHRQLLRSLMGIAKILVISPRFVEMERLKRICNHLEHDGLLTGTTDVAGSTGGFEHLVIFLTLKTAEDPQFVEMWRPVCSLQGLRIFTLRVYASSFKSGAWLLGIWNTMTGMELESEYGDWMTEVTTQKRHPFKSSRNLRDTTVQEMDTQVQHFQSATMSIPSSAGGTERGARSRTGKLTLSSENIHETNATGQAPVGTASRLVLPLSFTLAATVHSRTPIVYILTHELM
ncbi:hypothetical protein BGZ94_009098, partial [Podila epigama]